MLKGNNIKLEIDKVIRLLDLNAVVQKAGSLFNRLSLLHHMIGTWLDHDVTPDFLTKSVVITVHKSEEGDVVAFFHWGNHLDSDFDFLTWLHWIVDLEWRGAELITISLNEEGVLWPLELTSVSEGPSLCVNLACNDRESITEALLYESCLVNNLLLLRLLAALSC